MPSLRARRPDEELNLDNLAALVPVPLLQQVQDAFSATLRIPLLFVSPNGVPVTRSSGIEMFCAEVSRKIDAQRPCAKCGRLDRGPGASREAKPASVGPHAESPAHGHYPLIHKCPLGLRDVCLPITAGGRTIGFLLTSQTTLEPDAPHVVESARKLGMSPEAAVTYVSRIPVEPQQRVAQIAHTLGAVVAMVSELASAARNAQLAAVLDPLTGLASRDHFWRCLSREIEIADTHNFPVSVLLVDLDDFKAINDTFGHEAGDKVLQTVGQVLRAEIRDSDLAARYGSDAFLIMLRCADPTGADIVAWRLRKKIAACKMTARGQRVPISATVGRVTYPETPAREPDFLFKEALASLREAQSAAAAGDHRKSHRRAA